MVRRTAAIVLVGSALLVSGCGDDDRSSSAPQFNVAAPSSAPSSALSGGEAASDRRGVNDSVVGGAPVVPDGAAASPPPSGTPYLRFGGSGQAEVTPDRASLSFTVTATDDESKRALSRVSADARRVADALRGAGVDDDRLQTTSVNSYQQYDSKAWQASISVNVETRPEDAGRLLSVGNRAGADSVSGPNLSVEDSEAAYGSALDDAIDDANTKAAAAAKKTGGEVVSILSVEEGGPSGAPIGLASRAATEGDSAVTIEPGKQSVSASVTVTYVFAPK